LFTESIDLGKIKPKDGEKRVEVPLVLPSGSLRLHPGESKQVLVSFELRSREASSSELEGVKVRYHLVRSGETLWDISRRYGLTVEELRTLNNLEPSVVIHPDQKLLIGKDNDN
jgi:LysM repeat protein